MPARSGLLKELGLSGQEEQVLLLSISGLADKEVARELGIALDTVRTYWQRIRRKVGGQTRAELVARLVREAGQRALDAKESENEVLVSEVERRKTSEERLRRSQAMLNEAQLLSRTGSWEYEPESGAMVWTDGLFAVFGLDPHHPPSLRQLDDMLHPEDRDRVSGARRAVLRQGGSYQLDYRIVTASGHVRHVHSVGNATVVGGQVTRVFGTIQDVTERVEMEASLTRLGAILEAAPDMICVCDLDGSLRYVNPAGRRMLGLIEASPTHELHLSHFVPAWAATRILTEGFQRALEQGSWRCDGAVLIEGRERPVSQLVLAHRGPQGEATHLSIIALDLKKHRELEEQYRETEERLRRERDFLNAVHDIAGCLICVLDTEGRVVSFNTECERLTGWKEEEVLGKVLYDVLVPAEQREHVRALIAQACAGDERHDVQSEWLLRSGARRLTRWRNTSIRDESGNVRFVVGAGLDIQEQSEAQAALQKSEERLRLVTESIHEGLVVQDETGAVTFFNPAAERILGPNYALFFRDDYSFRLICIRADGAPFTEADHPSRIALRTGRAQNGVLMGILRGEHKVGWVVVNSVPLFQEGADKPHAVVTTFFDVTELKEYQQRLDEQVRLLNEAQAQLEARQRDLIAANETLRSLAETDGLTGVKNKRYFLERLEIEISAATRYGYPLSVVMLDLDHFKRFNDQYGHLEGDDVLRTLGQVLKRVSRLGDLAARYGGEEFALILPHVDQEQARKMAERLRREIEAERWPQGAGVTASIGVSTFNRAGLEPGHLLAEADRALYAAKAGGRNRVVHAEELMGPVKTHA